MNEPLSDNQKLLAQIAASIYKDSQDQSPAGIKQSSIDALYKASILLKGIQETSWTK